MPIRTIPFDQITADHVRDLIKRQVREGPTLDFKQELKFDDSAKLDLLGDVTAMANAVGGTIIYGAVEGEGEDRGLIVDVSGMAMEPDKVELTVSNLLRDNVDERLHGVQHRAIPLEQGTYLYVIRVPASPLAPHMVTLPSKRPRFHLRGTVSSDPMNARQIKEVTLRAEAAGAHARRLIEERTAAVRSRAGYGPHVTDPAEQARETSAVIFHVVPLFAPAVSIDLADAAVAERFGAVQPYGTKLRPGELRWTLEGLYTASRSGWALLTRSGAVEFGAYRLLQVAQFTGENLLNVGMLETRVLDCATQVTGLADAGVLAPPLVLSLRLLNVVGARMLHPRNEDIETQRLPYSDLIVEPMIVGDTAAGLERGLRTIFDVVWQAWGFPRSALYNADGTRLRWPPR